MSRDLLIAFPSVSVSNTEQLDRYFAEMCRRGIYPNAGNLRYYVRYLFSGVSLQGRRVLDIGAGVGLFGFYAASAGAARVVCLEPEAAGSTRGVRAVFDEVARALDLTNATMQSHTLQDFDAAGEQFDVVFLHNAINHLAEDSCVRLHRDEEARQIYREIFSKLSALTADGGTIIAADCARRNFFGDLGLRNPVASSIEWHKHQSPRLWAAMLADAGFSRPVIRWTSLNSLRGPGRLLLGNRVAAYFLTSAFCLRMSKSNGV